MNKLLKIEELAMFCLGIFLFSQLHFAWWWFALLLLTPDIGMIGYLINPKIGAFTYNLLHHRAVAISVYLSGIYFGNSILQLAGVIMFAHSSMDRILGFGLKYPDSFTHTHLEKIGK
ncbi:MAG: DUF4260 domain-containing protein [Candidatus Doudnabacteria bacterium]